jgi:hypothetical protein
VSSGLIDTRAVAHIDAVLRDIPAGQRNDVDLLLGRRCAVLPQQPYHERATVHIPACPTCESAPFYLTAEELAEAQGVIACDHCDTLIYPDNISDALRAAAHEIGVEAEWTPAHTPTDAEYERMSAGRPDGIVEHDDWLAGAP